MLHLGGGAVAAAPAPAVPDTTPPTITMRGPGVLGSTGVMTTTIVVGMTWVDPGATAVDDEDGDISNRIATSISSYVDATMPNIDTSAPTGRLCDAGIPWCDCVVF